MIVSAVGDPRARSTWSGTPSALVTAFEESGRHVQTFSARNAEPMIAKIAGSSLAALTRGRDARRFRHYLEPYSSLTDHAWQRWVESTRPESRTQYLHTDPLGMPSNKVYLPGTHSIFRDATPLQLIDGFELRSQSLRKKISDVCADRIARVSSVHCTSEWARQGFLDIGFNASQLQVVGSGIGFAPQSVSDDDFRAKSQSQILLCVAKVRHRQKGVDILLDALKKIAEVIPSVQLHLVAPLHAVTQQPNLVVHSNISFRSLQNLYRRASLYVMPARFEPWGLVYLEAMASGTPVIGSNKAAFPELCGHESRGWVVEDLSVDGVAEKCIEALRNEDEIVRRGKNALQHMQAGHSWLRVTDVIAGSWKGYE